MSFSPRNFRDALGSFPTGVTVVTSLDEGASPIGVTVSSFTSVSLDPPLILFCLDHRNANLQAFKNAHHFAINVLSAEQEDLSVRFSCRIDDRWKGVTFETWESGAPIFPGCLANLECRTVDRHESGDHLIVIGEVIRLASRMGDGPLIYFQGSYRRLAER